MVHYIIHVTSQCVNGMVFNATPSFSSLSSKMWVWSSLIKFCLNSVFSLHHYVAPLQKLNLKIVTFVFPGVRCNLISKSMP